MASAGSSSRSTGSPMSSGTRTPRLRTSSTGSKSSAASSRVGVQRDAGALGDRLDEVAATGADHAGPFALKGHLVVGVDPCQTDGRVERLAHGLRYIVVRRADVPRLATGQGRGLHVGL